MLSFLKAYGSIRGIALPYNIHIVGNAFYLLSKLKFSSLDISFTCNDRDGVRSPEINKIVNGLIDKESIVQHIYKKGSENLIFFKNSFDNDGKTDLSVMLSLIHI